MTEGYSISGSHAKSVALKPAGTRSGGKRLSVCGPVCGGRPARLKKIPKKQRAENAMNSRVRFMEDPRSTHRSFVPNHFVRDDPDFILRPTVLGICLMNRVFEFRNLLGKRNNWVRQMNVKIDDEQGDF